MLEELVETARPVTKTELKTLPFNLLISFLSLPKEARVG